MLHTYTNTNIYTNNSNSEGFSIWSLLSNGDIYYET